MIIIINFHQDFFFNFLIFFFYVFHLILLLAMKKVWWICFNETMWAWNELWKLFRFDHLIMCSCIYLSFFLF